MNRTAADELGEMRQAVGWYQTRMADREVLHKAALDSLEIVNLRLRGLLHSCGMDDAQIDLRIGGNP